MLVLTAKKEEGITIESNKTGEKIEVVVLDINGKNEVSLGFKDSDMNYRIARNKLEVD